MNTLRELARNFLGDTHGASLVEAAIGIPVVIIILAGAFDFGRAYSTLAVFGNTDGTGTSPIVGWKPTDITMASPTSCSGSGIGLIELDTTVTFNAVTWSFVGLPNSITLSTSHQERWIGG